MRLRTVSSIILPSAHKVKASARNSVTTVVGGGERCSGGLLKESPEPPRTFLKFFIGGGGVAVPKGGLPPAGGVPLRGTCYPSPGGEDHLKRRSSSPPVPPLLGCRHCSRESISCHSGGKPWTSLCAGHLLGRLCKCRRRLNAGDARGGAPCIRKQKIPPFPTGEGGWGDRGQKSKLKAGAAGDKEGKPPRRAPQRQG